MVNLPQDDASASHSGNGTDRAPGAAAVSIADPAFRFAFGRNWKRFLRGLDSGRIERAEQSLADLLGTRDLSGRTFLDVGCGSGIFSLAARRLGASVVSFDYDTDSVDCALALRRRFFPDDADWTIQRGSVLDADFLAGLGSFDIVYAWGVLHHTGAMWQAIDNVQRNVAPGGRIVIAIYNDCGRVSERWVRVKRTYCRMPRPVQPIFAAAAMAPYEIREALSLGLRGRFGEYVRSWTQYRQNRGMSKWSDIVDWVGGYPYEYASAEEITDRFETAGFTTLVANTTHTIGCNEFVFQRAG